MRPIPALKYPALMIGLALLGAGCVADDPDPNIAFPTPDKDLEIVLNEFSFAPSTLKIRPGETINLVLVNNGSANHEFMLGQQLRPAGGYETDLLTGVLLDASGTGFSTAGLDLDSSSEEPDEHTEEPDEPDEHTEEPEEMAEEAMGEMGSSAGGHDAAHTGGAITVEPGGRVVLKLRFPSEASGVWEFGCFIEGHYEAGMFGALAVLNERA